MRRHDGVASRSVIRSEEIERQAAVSQGLGEILGQTVPGLAVGTRSMSNYGTRMVPCRMASDGRLAGGAMRGRRGR